MVHTCNSSTREIKQERWEQEVSLGSLASSIHAELHDNTM